MTRRSTLALILACIGLAACGGDIVQRTRPPLPGTHATLRYAARSGEMATIILGNPFDAPQAEVDAAVLAAMGGSYAGPELRFTTTPGPEAPAGYAIVVLLGGPAGMDASVLCDAPRRDVPLPAVDETSAVIAFCAHGQALSSVWARAGRIASPADPAFRGMIARAMVELIPTTEWEERDLRR